MITDNGSVAVLWFAATTEQYHGARMRFYRPYAVLQIGDLDWPAILALLDPHVREGLADAILDERVKVALNGAVLSNREALVARNGDEVAFLPPVSGG